MYGQGSGDTLKSYAGVDGLYGQGGGDRLSAGPGEDLLSPGAGNDASDGGADADLYSFGPGNWSRDTVEDPNAGNRIHLDDVGGALTINLVSGALPEMKNASGKSTVNWSGSVIDDVVNQNSGDDEIHGNAAANDLDSFAGGGDDAVYGEGESTRSTSQTEPMATSWTVALRATPSTTTVPP